MIKKCCLCGIKFEGYGNNPYPLCDVNDYDSRCCNECNSKYVIPSRIIMVYKGKSAEEVFNDYKKEKEMAK